IVQSRIRSTKGEAHVEVANPAMGSSVGRSRCCAGSSSRVAGQIAEVQRQPSEHAQVLVEVISQTGIELNELGGGVYSSLKGLNFGYSSFRFRRLRYLARNGEGCNYHCEQDKERT